MNKTQEKLELNKISEIISNYAITYNGKDFCRNINTLSPKDIVKSEKQISEAVKLLYKLGSAPLQETYDIFVHLKILDSSNSLNAKQLLDLVNILKISKNLKEYFSSEIIKNSDFPYLSNIFENLYTNPGIIEAVSKAIIDESTIDDNASSKLKEIRNTIFQKDADIHNKLQSLLHSKYLQEPIITIRNNRYVVPVKSEYRSEIKGFVHDTSSSGSTVFVEPMSIFEINNDIANLRNEENIEIEKILMKLSSLFFDITDNIQNTFNLIGLIDFTFAKAKYSKQYDMCEPILNSEKFVNLINCYHPLLDQNTVIKNDIYIGNDYNILIITGPNTGGKTVILKTIGLICLMAKCGLHIPAKEGSSVYIFDDIYADIGDEQSIADSLSTFSSHISNISYILSKMTVNSLVLIDELGSGTDPIEGSALGISIIEHLNKNNILSVITTHYHEIKTYAINTSGIKNASVGFNFETLMPTYKLLMGVPGRSNAFIISKRLGISNNIIENAQNFISNDTNKLEDILNEIHKEKELLDNNKIQIESDLKEIESLKQTIKQQENDLISSKNEIINKAKLEAREILLSAKEESDEIISELSNTKDFSHANKLRNKLNDKIKSETPIKENLASSDKLDKNKIMIGTNVFIPSLNQEGTIISNITKDNCVQVQIGLIKMSFNISDLAPSISDTNLQNAISKSSRKLNTSSISPEINVIGQNVEEACFVIDKYLDNCVVNGLYQVRIVHGKGTGILRKGIHNFLKNHPHVQNYRIGTFGEGEMGVTIVELK